MKKIKAAIAHNYLFRLAPALYKKFWYRKLGFHSGQYLKIERELKWMPLFMHKDTVFFDVGANIGLYLYLAEKLGVEKAYAFEPVPFLYKKLKSIFPQYEVKNLAFFTAKGKHTLRIPVVNGENIETRASLTGLFPQQKVVEFEVETDSIDAFCSDHSIVPTFIKMDVEGAENGVIEGAAHLLETAKPYLMIEIEKQHNPRYQEIIDFIKSKNYRCFYLDTDGKSLGEYRDIDALQVAEAYGSPHYVNNFLFIPSADTNMITKLARYEA